MSLDCGAPRRVPCFLGRALTVANHQKLPSQMVGKRSQILKDVPKDGRKIIGDGGALCELKDQIASLRIVLSNDWIWCGTASEELMDMAIELTDAMFGLLTFRQTSSVRVTILPSRTVSNASPMFWRGLRLWLTPSRVWNYAS